MNRMNHRSVFLILLTCALACDKRTAEEKGRDLASNKLDMAQGAASALEERAQKLGTSVGHGVGDLVRGVGGGVDDVLHPTVAVELDASARAAGVDVTRASRGDDVAGRGVIVAHLTFASAFAGRLELRAFGADGTELGRGRMDETVDIEASAATDARFGFDAAVRLGTVKSYRLLTLPALRLATHQSLEGVTASQLRLKGNVVSVYLVFERPFQGTIEARALADDASELGRAALGAPLKQAVGSATRIELVFDDGTAMGRVAGIELKKK